MSKLLRVTEAAAELSISRSLLYELIAAGEIRPVPISRRGIRIQAEELDRFIEKKLASQPQS